MPSHSSVPPRRFGNATLSFFAFVLVSALAGALVATLVLPAVALVKYGQNTVTDIYESIPTDFKIAELPERSEIYAMDDSGNPVLLASFFDQNREQVTGDRVSQYVKDGLVAAEDPRFYTHGGVDFQGIARAALSNYFGNDLQGASTISQQYVKNTLVQNAEALTDPAARETAYEEATETTVARKVEEIKAAIELEKTYSKDEILLGYLNMVGFGSRVYGIQAASRYYYNVDASDLSLNQAATLIGIVNRPNALRIDQPDNADNGAENGYALALDRRNYVLNSMLNEKFITQEEHDAARAEPITPTITPVDTGCVSAQGAAYFCDYVMNILKTDPTFGETEEQRLETLRRGGMKIYTTLDMSLQRSTEDSVNRWVPKVTEGVNLGGASVSIQPGTGRILAMAQNKDYTEDPEVAATSPSYTAVNYNADALLGGSAGFQPGSTYKLFTLVEWLEQGHSLYERVNGKSRFTNFTNSCEGNWQGNQVIRNDNGSFGGRTTALRSTINSTNTGFMAMAEKLDLCAIRDTATAMGVHRADGATLQSNPASVLGTNEIAPLQMASAYATIAAGGITCTPIAIERIVNAAGEEMPVPNANCARTVDERVAGLAATALQQVVTSGTGTASRIRDGVPMIGKTGTTNDAIHTWMIGSTTNVATAVWVGNVSGDTNMREYYPQGVQAAQIRHRIFPEVMRAANAEYGGNGFAAGN